MPTAIACRVARRHAREAAFLFREVPAESARIEYTDSGRISAVALMKMLEPQLGVLVKLRFRRSLKIDPNGVEWEAITENANIISGKLVLRAAVAESEVISWAEVTVDEDRDALARRVAARYMRDSGGLVRVNDEESDELVDDEAEQIP
jgi:hypothetical protein